MIPAKIAYLKKPKHTGNELEMGLTDDANFRKGWNAAIDAVLALGDDVNQSVWDNKVCVPKTLCGIQAMDIALRLRGKWRKRSDEKDTEHVKRIYSEMIKHTFDIDALLDGRDG